MRHHALGTVFLSVLLHASLSACSGGTEKAPAASTQSQEQQQAVVEPKPAPSETRQPDPDGDMLGASANHSDLDRIPHVIGATEDPLENNGTGRPVPRTTNIIEIYAASTGEVPVDTSLIRKLEVCTTTSCHTVKISKPGEPLDDNTSGNASRIGTAEVPITPITRVNLTSIARGKSVANATTTLHFERPIKLHAFLSGLRIFAGIDARASCAESACLSLSGIDAGYYKKNGESDYTYYNPKTGLTKNLALGASIHIPPGATDKIRLFSVRAYRGLGNYPTIHILPEIKLNKKTSIFLKELDTSWISGAQAVDDAFEKKEEEQQKKSPPKVLEIEQTGKYIEGDSEPSRTKRPSSSKKNGISTIHECLQRLASHEVQEYVNNSFAMTGFSVLRDCEKYPRTFISSWLTAAGMTFNLNWPSDPETIDSGVGY